MHLTVVGAAADLTELVEAFPDAIDGAVEAAGECDRHHGTPAASLTDRQLEAVEIAVGLGYYDVPRTDSTLLRKAERRVMARLVRG